MRTVLKFMSRESVCSFKNWEKIYRSDVQDTLSFMVIWYVYRSIIPNKSTFNKCFRTRWISKLLESFAVHWVRQYFKFQVSQCRTFYGFPGMANAIFFKGRTNFHRAPARQIALILTLGLYQHPMFWFIRFNNFIMQNMLWTSRCYFSS